MEYSSRHRHTLDMQQVEYLDLGFVVSSLEYIQLQNCDLLCGGDGEVGAGVEVEAPKDVRHELLTRVYSPLHWRAFPRSVSPYCSVTVLIEISVAYRFRDIAMDLSEYSFHHSTVATKE